jgi:hypothetical protein
MNAPVDINVLLVISTLIVNVVAVAGIVHGSSLRLEKRLTKLETSFMFILRIVQGKHMKFDEDEN